jgi:hypothetical protein
VPSLPPLPDVPHVIGIGAGRRHAVRHEVARSAVDDAAWTPRPEVAPALAECGLLVVLARKWGGFGRGNPWLEQTPESVCPMCAWTVALGAGTVEAELAARTPRGRELAVLGRLLPDPMLVPRVCRAVLAGAACEDGHDHPHLAQMLAHATAHAPVILADEDCWDRGCGHRPEDRWDDPAWECPLPDAFLACGACSARLGPWAGECEGCFAEECIIAAPCAVLTTIGRHFGVEPGARRRVAGSDLGTLDDISPGGST